MYRTYRLQPNHPNRLQRISRLNLFRILIIVGLLCSPLAAIPADAASLYELNVLDAVSVTFTVNGTSDTVDANPGDGTCADATGLCTLRAAIMESNAVAGADTISLPAGFYELSITGPGEDLSVTGDLDITEDLSLVGAGPGQTVISGNGLIPPAVNQNDRLFHIINGGIAPVVSFSGMTIQDAFYFGVGALIDNQGGVVSITDLVLRNSRSNSDGSSVFNVSNGIMTIVDTAFVDSYGSNGGAIRNDAGSTATLTNVTFGTTTSASGAAVLNRGTMTLINATIFNGRNGIFSATGGSTTIQNTVLDNHGNGSTNCMGDLTTYTSLGNNISNDGTCSTALNAVGDFNNTDPLLSDLAYVNGTVVVPPYVGSPLLDAGNNGVCLATDQRGAAHSDGACDIGSYEGSIPVPTVPSIASAANAISGFIYRDYDANGARQRLEPGVPNVTVTAYNASNAIVSTTQTGSDGSYSLSVPDGTTVRLEVTGIPAYLQPGAQGSDSGTTVQFLTSPAAAADVALANPAQYCQENPSLAVSCYVLGDYTTRGSMDVLISFPYSSGSNTQSGHWGLAPYPTSPYDSPAHTLEATMSQVGTTWGIAHQRSTGNLYSAALMKRHTGFGPGGPGAIYQVTPAGAVSVLANLSAGVDPHPALGATPLDWQVDANSFGPVGKMGLGDLDISEDDQTLYTINLADRNIYEITIADGTSTSVATPTSLPGAARGCIEADVRPFALGVNDGTVYVGMVCSAETSQLRSDLRAYVYGYNPNTDTFGSAPVLEFALDYQRGSAFHSYTPSSADWLPWNVGNTMPTSVSPLTTDTNTVGLGEQFVYPQPMLEDIEFDNGAMVLAFMDRTGHQVGYGSNFNDYPARVGLIHAIVAGDLLRACPSGGGWVLENNGRCGGITTAGADNYQGPGNGEYYFQENLITIHQELTSGGIAQIPGRKEIVSVAYDVARWSLDIFSGGIMWSDNETGTWQRGYRVFDSDTMPTTMGKANGLGDIDVMCSAAPLEIGNRVWQDVNSNGIQEPGEAVFAGVVVTLHDMDNSGTQVGSVTTDANGNYYFGGVNNLNMSSGSVLAGRNYEVRIDVTQSVLTGFSLTTANAGGDSSNDNKSDLNDSDGLMVSNSAVIHFSTGLAGHNNHTLDFGFSNQYLSLGNLVWLDNGVGGGIANNGLVDGSEAGIAGATVELYQSGDVVGTNTPVQSMTTDANGNYFFTDLTAGDYFVHLPNSNFASGAALVTLFSSTDPGGVAVDPDTDVDNDDNGEGDAANQPETSGVSSPDVTLSYNMEPTADGDDENSNLTVDFGLVRYDKGDLPDSGLGTSTSNYETLTTGGVDGPRHVIVPGVYLGAGVDAENDGQPSVNADGDDIGDGNDDEDGVTIVSLLPGETGTIQVNANVAGYLNGWIDWNGDGDFDDAGEQIATDRSLSAGDSTFTINVPATIASTLYSRFRFTSDDPAGQLGATGAWNNGEVEDYRLESFNLGNRVWLDLDGDGLIGSAESGIGGVTVRLYSMDANGAPTGGVLDTVVTDSDGYYLFQGLAAGNYMVSINSDNFEPGAPLAGMASTLTTETTPNSDGDNNDNGIDADPLQDRIRSGLITLGISSGSGEPIDESDLGSQGHGGIGNDHSNLTVDFGFISEVRVGDLVWYDNDQDGVQDSDEAGVSGVVVTLYNATTNSPIASPLNSSLPMTTTTDANGLYLFESLPVGNYYVVFDLNTLPSNHVVTLQDAQVGGTNDDATDSDASPASGQSGSTGVLNGGDEDLSLDMGIYLVEDVRVGDRVWYDADRDGVQDLGEQGVLSVTVVLYDSVTDLPVVDGSGNPMTDETDASGLYLFEALPPGDYYVKFDLTTLPEAYQVTLQNVGTNDGADSDADPTTGETGRTGMLNAGQQDLTLDMGIWQPVRVGNYVWYDDDANGIQDLEEKGVAGVTVTLYDAETYAPVDDPDNPGSPMTETTDENGLYLFENLAPGQYYVVFDLDTIPADYVVTAQDLEASDSADSDANPVSGQTAPTEILMSGEEDLTLDMGIWEPVTVGDYVWYDTNGNGTQELDEEGVSRVEVTLYDATTEQPVLGAAGQVLLTGTDENGRYLFENLKPGAYYVVFDLSTLPNGYRVTVPNAISNDGADSDANPMTGQVGATDFLSSGEKDLTLDMGIWLPVRVGDYVWYDENADGQQDDDEPGVEGVTVVLYDALTNQPVMGESGSSLTMETDAKGAYLFDNLPLGNYYVVFNLSTLPAGYDVTTPNVGDDGLDYDGLDSDASASNGQTGATGFLTSGEEDLTLDMGIYILEAVRVGDTVWEDLDLNGLQDVGEPGVSGVEVTLYSRDAPETAIATQTTDTDGHYLFDDLPPGDYYVVFNLATLPEGYVVTMANAGDDALDSDGDLSTGESGATGFLGSGEEDLTLDMGIYQLASLGDFVWLDGNANGLQEIGEAGVPNVTVQLYMGSGTFVSETTTDGSGLYLFTGLVPGDYYVQFVLPGDYGISPAHQGSDDDIGSNDDIDSDVDAETGQTPVTTLTSGEHDLSWDAGLFQGAALGNYVWNDLNADGVQGEGELGIPNVEVQLFNGEGKLLAETATDGDGFYGFTDWAAGEYYVEFKTPADSVASPSNQGDDDAMDSDADPDSGQTATIPLFPGDSNLTLDAGFTIASSMGSYVWLDVNKDGVFDEGEAGVGNVTVILYDDQGNVVAETVTTNDGYFIFMVPAGEYTIQFIPPSGFVFTVPNVGEDDSVDSDVDPATGMTAPITLDTGENDFSLFAGLNLSPTAVELLSLMVAEEEGAVSVQWMTGAELDTFGYNIYRSVDGTFENAELLNNSLLLGQGSGGVYLFTDMSAKNQQIYSYWLEEVQSDGSVNRYGPHRVIVTNASEVTFGYQLFLPMVSQK